MSSLSVTISPDEIGPALSRFAVAARNPHGMMSALATKLANNTQLRFPQEKAPDGTPWKALLPAYAQIKKGPGILRGEQNMSGGLQGSIVGMAVGNQVIIGSNKVYAGVHQFGAVIRAKNAPALRFRLAHGMVSVKSVTIPARPYLGLSEEDRLDILEAAEFFFRRALKG